MRRSTRRNQSPALWSQQQRSRAHCMPGLVQSASGSVRLLWSSVLRSAADAVIVDAATLRCKAADRAGARSSYMYSTTTSL